MPKKTNLRLADLKVSSFITWQDVTIQSGRMLVGGRCTASGVDDLDGTGTCCTNQPGSQCCE